MLSKPEQIHIDPGHQSEPVAARVVVTLRRRALDCALSLMLATSSHGQNVGYVNCYQVHAGKWKMPDPESGFCKSLETRVSSPRRSARTKAPQVALYTLSASDICVSSPSPSSLPTT